MFRRIFRWFTSETIEGYEHPELIDVIFRKTLAYEPKGSWPEIGTATSVLDFGGGCGIHYKQARSQTVRWAVVETSAMVARALEVQTDKLRFFTTIEDAASWLGNIDLMHSNGAIQYTKDPLATVVRLCDLNARRLLWQRCAFSEYISRQHQVSRLADNGPGKLASPSKNVSYEVVRIPEGDFLAAHSRYHLMNRGPDWFHFTLKDPD